MNFPNLKVPGFKAGAVAAGIRYANRLDVGLILADQPCAASGIFTTNYVKAPSIVLNKRRLRSRHTQAVLVNSGNANACVGPRGWLDTLECTGAVAAALGIRPNLVIMNSTGVIGEPLPAARLTAAIPSLLASLREDGLSDFTQSIMTTDTRPKAATRLLEVDGRQVTIAGMVKGAGMIMPNMATLLAYVLTDAAMPGPELHAMLTAAARDSFNALTIDGDTSTSDSLLLLASGASGVSLTHSPAVAARFQAALQDLCLELALAVAADGEGATKWFEIRVEGARQPSEADKIARRIANSPLVKTAFHAGDPNWGRIMMAVGSSGVRIDPEKVNVDFQAAQGQNVAVVRAGALSDDYSEAQAGAILAGSGFIVKVDLGLGEASRSIYTCDLSAEYVKINASYRS